MLLPEKHISQSCPAAPPEGVHGRRVRWRVDAQVLAPHHLAQQVVVRVGVQRSDGASGTKPRVHALQGVRSSIAQHSTSQHITA